MHLDLLLPHYFPVSVAEAIGPRGKGMDGCSRTTSCQFTLEQEDGAVAAKCLVITTRYSIGNLHSRATSVSDTINICIAHTHRTNINDGCGRRASNKKMI